MSVKPCCRDTENLEVVEVRDHVVVRRCQICGCRHIEATLQPLPTKTSAASAG